MVRPPEPDGGSAVLRLDDATAHLVTQHFQTVAHDLADLQSAFATIRTWIGSGAGELADAIAPQAQTYAAGWTTGIDILSTAASLIAGNTNHLAIDLRAADQGIASAISILPPEQGS